MADVEIQYVSGRTEESKISPSSFTPEDILVRGRSELLIRVNDIAILHNVEIPTDTVDLTSSIVLRYYDKFAKKGEDLTLEKICLEVMWLITKTITKLHHDFENKEDLKRLDKEGYLFLRNFVELCQFREERVQYASSYLSRIEEEHKILRDLWGGFAENYVAAAKWKESARRTDILVNIWQHLCHILEFQDRGDHLLGELQSIQTLVDEYMRNIPSIIMRCLTVSPNMVAQVASIDTGTPASWLLNSFKPPLDSLRDRLARRVVGQDHVIEKIVSRLSRNHASGSGPSPSPLASFLFLHVSTFGVIELARTLAEELFDDKKQFVWLDFSNRVAPWMTNDEELMRCKHNRLRKTLVQVVKANQFFVLLLLNVDKHKYAVELLANMLTKGVIIDEEGESFELSNALIILTCSNGVSECNPVSCKCTEMDCSEKDAAMGTTSSEEHDCDVLRFHRTVLETRRRISELVDEELVLNNLSPADLDCTTRIWCREIIDETLEGHQLILYPSEAFVHFLAASYGKVPLKHAMGAWFKSKSISEMYSDADNGTIHCVDVLAGTGELSYRALEVDDRVNSALVSFRAILNQWKPACRSLKRSAEEIFNLGRMHETLLQLINDTETDCSRSAVEAIKDHLGCIVADTVNSESLDIDCFSVPLCLVDDVVADLREGDFS